MNLKIYLIVRIVGVGALCLAVTSGYILYQADRKSTRELSKSADSIEHQLELQRLRIDVGAETEKRFPDLAIWGEKGLPSGRCIRFSSAESKSITHLCQGESASESTPPAWFDRLYRWFFEPGRKFVRHIEYRGRNYGTVKIFDSPETEIDRAWRVVSRLMGLSMIMVTALCILVYFNIRTALLPAKEIIGHLRLMEKGNLSVRVGDFDVNEWRDTGQALNRLAERLEKSIEQRQQLTVLLMNAQETERRHLARELHDEFGQCLTGLNAVAESICRSAQDQMPELHSDGESVKAITAHMLELLQEMLSRIRPSGLDEFGLVTALNNLVGTWNTRNSGRIRFEFIVDGEIPQLPEPVPVNLYRIVQECLTNISKHSSGAHGLVCLQCGTKQVDSNTDQILQLTVADNGQGSPVNLENRDGLGLLGIRERVLLIGGTLDLEQVKSGGFSVKVTIPLANCHATTR